MDQKRILIIGAKGQLGKALLGRYPQATPVDYTELDITSRKAVEAYDWSSVDVVLNAAAYTNVNAAENEGRVAAWQVNAVGPANLAAMAARHNLTLVHVSSDYVFDGTAVPHTEDELFSPLNVYGQAKAAGDIAVATAPQHYIVRTTWLIGDGPNFIRTMLDLGRQGTNPTVVADQIGRLTFVDELVRIIDHLLATKAPYGTYNATNGGEPASWAEIARAIFAASGQKVTVQDTTTEEYYAHRQVAPRPLKSIMSLEKLQGAGFISRDWRDELKEYVAKELGQKP